MPQALNATVRRVIKPPHHVVIKESKTVEVFEGDKLVDTKTETPPPRSEWRVIAVVYEDFVGEKEVTLSRTSEEEAAKLVEGAIAYCF